MGASLLSNNRFDLLEKADSRVSGFCHYHTILTSVVLGLKFNFPLSVVGREHVLGPSQGLVSVSKSTCLCFSLG